MSAEPRQYVIWSIEHAAWWRANWQGYTPSLHEAGRYGLVEGEGILRRANLVAFHECLIPVSALGAASELLAACKVFLAKPDSDEAVDVNRDYIDTDAAIDRIRAAVAKAEGR